MAAHEQAATKLKFKQQGILKQLPPAKPQATARPSVFVIDLTNVEDDDHIGVLTAMQTAYDGAHMRVLYHDHDIVLNLRHNIDKFLQDCGAQMDITEVDHNLHSLPGTPLYVRFKAAFDRVKDKSIRMVFHGT
eukprot:COSAG01_NODE_31617_length_594_cov_1.670707_1_plen_132_part_01